MSYQYAWSWNTAAALAAAVMLHWLLSYLLKRRYVKEHLALTSVAETLEKRPPTFCDKSVIDRKSMYYSRELSWWLWSFRYLRSDAIGLKVLCMAVQVSSVVAIYFIFAEPIYFESSQ